MPGPTVNTYRGETLHDSYQIPPDGKVEVKKEEADGITTYNIHITSASFDEVPNSEREARTPVIHAHAPGDPVNEEPEMVELVEVDGGEVGEPAPETTEEAPAEGSAPAAVAPVAAQKKAMSAGTKSDGTKKEPPATETKDSAAAKKTVKK